MTKPDKSEADHIQEARNALAAASLEHVVFDGWSKDCFDAALKDSGINPDLARIACPRGAVDLAIELHRQGDQKLVAEVADMDLATLRYSERVAALVKRRIELAGDPEVVRKSASLFALPQHMAEGSGLIWGTSDKIWRALGDTSDDFNWYSKRVILSGVYSATLLFWLGDDCAGKARTWAFLDQRIADVMRFERFKSSFRTSSLGKAFARGPGVVLSKIKAPTERATSDLPGHIGRTN